MKLLLIFIIIGLAGVVSAKEGASLPMDPAAELIEYDPKIFKADPDYSDKPYDAAEQLHIYGGKVANDEPFYPHFFGRRLYPLGQFTEGLSILGKKNRMYPHLMGFGDFRLAFANFDDGIDERAEIAARLNLDLDLKITSTERLHAFVRPLDRNGKFTRVLFNNGEEDFDDRLDFNLDALFFEGDLAWIWTGISGNYAKFDLPFAVGLMPILFHNGIWLNDIFTGVAFTIPAKNSPLLDISNMDITFFAGNDEINSPLLGQGNDVNDVAIYGFNSFIEAANGYFEIGYAYTEDELLGDGDQSYHNVAFSYSHRWSNILSLSYRVIGNFGQEDIGGVAGVKSADGALLLLDTSWITSLPYTLVPYLNFFVGIDKPQSVARAGGILQNTGILFEGDGLTGFPTLDADANDTMGASLGIEYLFNLDQQIVFEATAVIDSTDGAATGNKKNNEYGLGMRWQKPIAKTWILRADAMYGFRDLREEIFGVRTELRWKF